MEAAWPADDVVSDPRVRS